MKHEVAKSCTLRNTRAFTQFTYQLLYWCATLLFSFWMIQHTLLQGPFAVWFLLSVWYSQYSADDPSPYVSARELWAWCPHAYLPSQPLQQHLWCFMPHQRWHIEPGGERWRETVNVEYKRVVEREKNRASEDEKRHTSVSLKSSDEGGMWQMKGSTWVVMRGERSSWWRW